MKLKTIFLITGVVISTFSFAKKTKTLIMCSEGSPDYLSPILSTSGISFDASANPIYNRIVEFEYGTTTLTPTLAESWIVSPDNKEIIFKLRKGVKFHSNKNFKPTRDFNADDVIFSFNRQLDKNHPYYNVSGGQYLLLKSMEFDKTIKEIKKINDYTVKFTLNNPDASFMANMTMPFGSIYSAEYADKMMKKKTPEKIDTNPIGTGPFTFVSYRKDSQIRYSAFKNYYRAKTPVDNMVYSINLDPSVRLAKMERGECHVMPYPNPNDLNKIRANPKLKLVDRVGLNVGAIIINTENKLLKNPEVRKALRMAINKQEIVNALFNGTGLVAKNIIPPTMGAYHNDSTLDLAYNPQEAEKILAANKITKGTKFTLLIRPGQENYMPNFRKAAEMIQSDLKKVGIDLNILQVELSEQSKLRREGRFELALAGWGGDNGDPDNFFTPLFSCASIGSVNASRYCNPKYEEQINIGRQSFNIQTRINAYHKAQDILNQDNPWIVLTHGKINMVLSEKVQNYQIDPLNLKYFYGVDLKD